MADETFTTEAPAAPTGDAPQVEDSGPLRERRGFSGKPKGRGPPRRRRDDEGEGTF